MTHLIRNYQAGSQIVLSEHLRHHLAEGGDMQISEAELARQLRVQAEEMAAQASVTLANARKEADALLQKAQEEVAVLQAEAQARGFEEGYQQGIADGRAVGEQSLASAVEDVQAVLLSVQNERTHLLLQSEHEVASLALAIAEKIVGRLGQEQKELITWTVNRALNELTITGPFSLRVHPDDAAYLDQAWSGVNSDGETYAWKLVPDAEIEQGGCVLVCGPATVDARLSSQLRSIIDGLALTDYRLDNEDREADTAESQKLAPRP